MLVQYNLTDPLILPLVHVPQNLYEEEKKLHLIKPFYGIWKIQIVAYFHNHC